MYRPSSSGTKSPSSSSVERKMVRQEKQPQRWGCSRYALFLKENWCAAMAAAPMLHLLIGWSSCFQKRRLPENGWAFSGSLSGWFKAVSAKFVQNRQCQSVLPGIHAVGHTYLSDKLYLLPHLLRFLHIFLW